MLGFESPKWIFSQGTAREQPRQNMLPTVGATQVPLEGKQHRGLLQGMIIEWNRDWIGSSCHCQTHRQVDDSSPQAPRVWLVRKKQSVWMALCFAFAFKPTCTEQVGYSFTWTMFLFSTNSRVQSCLFLCKYADSHANWGFQLNMGI